MKYIILDAGGTAIQFSNGDIVVYEDEQKARDDMQSNDILIGISYCDDDGGGSDDLVRYYCTVEGVDNDEEYTYFILREDESLQEKLKDAFLPKID